MKILLWTYGVPDTENKLDRVIFLSVKHIGKPLSKFLASV